METCDCRALPELALWWPRARGSQLPGVAREPQRDCRDYPVVDDRGRRVGVIRGVSQRPAFGPNAPTVFLQRGGGAV
jgi:hypothetical protein